MRGNTMKIKGMTLAKASSIEAKLTAGKLRAVDAKKARAQLHNHYSQRIQLLQTRLEKFLQEQGIKSKNFDAVRNEIYSKFGKAESKRIFEGMNLIRGKIDLLKQRIEKLKR